MAQAAPEEEAGPLSANTRVLEPDEPETVPSSLPGSWINLRETRRTYQNYDPDVYNLPNDVNARSRLHSQHFAWDLILEGRLSTAPIAESLELVLDIGTGTGLWAQEFAADHPLARVVGTDLTLSQVDDSNTPPNCEFIVESSETKDWAFESVGYVHRHNMGSCFDDVQTVFRKAYDALRSGGWIEIQDSSWEISFIDEDSRGSSLAKWYQLVFEAGLKCGRRLDKLKECKTQLLGAGFVGVEEEIIVCPGGMWAKEPVAKQIGLLAARALLQKLSSFRKFIADAGVANAEDMDEICQVVAEEVGSNRIRWTFPLYLVCGQKPAYFNVHSLKTLELLDGQYSHAVKF